VAGNHPYSQLTNAEVGVAATPIFTIGPIAATATSLFSITANVTFVSQGDGILLTVGRATADPITTPATTSTNIANGATPVTLPSVGYLGSLAELAGSTGTQNPLDNGGNPVNVNVNGVALDSPGTADTYFYTIWMSATFGPRTYASMKAFLSVLQVTP
jgi:hypothetical protein